ncbi:MAG: insulinase family protein [Acidobacteriota bacterium]|nr:MAG: insulinase family protein [Acidobacteriota bacterium]
MANSKVNIQESRLENGIVVLTDRMAGVRSATLGFFYRVGSRHEPVELNGITHFIEHCVFKGTPRRTAKQIAIEQDRLGGNLDAFTTHDETGFVIKVTDDRINDAFDLIADMLTAPSLDEADLENEQRVIIEEMKMHEDAPEELINDIFYREFFPGDPLGLPITGTAETVRSFGSDRTRDYHRQVFTPQNLVIAAAGNVEHDRLVDMVGSAEHFNSADIENPRSAFRDPQSAAPIFIEKRSDLEQGHMILATPFTTACDERRYAADMLANIIGGGTSSRLWQSVREERGLAYSVGTSTAMYRDTGFFAVSAGTSPDQVEEVLDIVMDEMRWVVRNGVSDDEISLIKDQARASILLGLEDSAGRAGSLAHCELTHGRQIAVEETLAKIDAVTREDIAAIAREYFTTENVAFVALGDLEGLVVDRDRLAI